MEFTVRQARNLAGYSQKKMAAALGMSIGTYIARERRPGGFTMEQARQFCKAVGINMELINFFNPDSTESREH